MKVSIFLWMSSVLLMTPQKVYSETQPVEWKVLLIIKSRTDVHCDGCPRIVSKMTKEDVSSVSLAFKRYFPFWVKRLTNGHIRLRPKVIISRKTLRSVSSAGENFYVSPQDVTDEIDKYAPLGEFDSTFVYWKGIDDRTKVTLPVGFGYALGPTWSANLCGYTSIHHREPKLWTKYSETSEVFIHEWLHQLEAFYEEKGVRLPEGKLHGAERYGYKHHNGWKHWYEDFLNGNVKDASGNKLGLGQKAWCLGTIRDEAQLYRFEYFSNLSNYVNLVENCSFELPWDNRVWKLESWLGNKEACQISSISHQGMYAIRISSDKADDIRLTQIVSIKPNTRYLFNCWAKTENVTINEEGGNTGANLSQSISSKTSLSLVGSSDWKYLAVVFDSKNNAKVKISLRLGHHGSTCTGKAWFDDVKLIEIQNPIR